MCFRGDGNNNNIPTIQKEVQRFYLHLRDMLMVILFLILHIICAYKEGSMKLKEPASIKDIHRYYLWIQ